MPLIANQNVKVGQVVKLTSQKWGDSAYNPVWGGIHGEMTGVIERLLTDNEVYVKWSNGNINYYFAADLSLVETVGSSTTPPSVTATSLTSATASVIEKQFMALDKSFSVHDILTTLRAEANAGRIVIENRAFETIDGIAGKVQKIERDEVRQIVRDFMSKVTSYTRVFNGTYFVYQPNMSPSTPATSTQAAPSLTITPTGSVSSPASSAPVGPAPEIAPDAVKAYILNRGTRTLKQIQSRFKVEGKQQPTVRYLASAAMNAGLVVEVRSPYYSSVVRS